MAQLLEQAMSHAYEDLQDRQRLGADTSLLKTYLVEAHSANAGHEEILRLIRSAFGTEGLGDRAESRIAETDEELFFNIDTHWGNEEATFHIDATDQRFWILHTTSRSTSSDRILHRVILNSRKLDSAWLPMQLLERVAQLGSLRGLGLDYDRREIPDVDFEAENSPVEFLKMQLWGNRAGEILRILRQIGAFPEATTLSKVKVKHWLDRAQDENSFSLADVKYDGKITARGTSFQSHANLVSIVYRNYGDRIREFEGRFALAFDQDEQGHVLVAGEPLTFSFSRPIADMEIFLASVFSGAAPFRLWGVPTKGPGEYFRVSAIDLHVDHQIRFEITPNFMRAYLPQDTCGNSIIRLFTNLQHYYDSQVDIRTGNLEAIF